MIHMHWYWFLLFVMGMQQFGWWTGYFTGKME